MNRRPLGTLRIIGGQWRSRLIDFDAQDGVRPTPDRVRQTVFDWLAPQIEGAVCLDLFAGSGALGMEALSRGAGHVSFVDAGRAQIERIQANLRKLGADQGHVINDSAEAWLRRTSLRFEVVFIDPPYDQGAQLDALMQLLPRVLKPDNRVYLEWRTGGEPLLPEGWFWLRRKQAGQVSYGLLTCSGASPAHFSDSALSRT